jgi:hypothetical protein
MKKIIASVIVYTEYCLFGTLVAYVFFRISMLLIESIP